MLCALEVREPTFPSTRLLKPCLGDFCGFLDYSSPTLFRHNVILYSCRSFVLVSPPQHLESAEPSCATHRLYIMFLFVSISAGQSSEVMMKAVGLSVALSVQTSQSTSVTGSIPTCSVDVPTPPM